MKPVIGIIICKSENGRQFVTQPYITAVERSGGIPVLIPCTSEFRSYNTYLTLCKGFLFCGGDDITPMLYGEDPLPGIGDTDMETDIFQLSFMEYVLLTGSPILGICRGMQILNTALGGSIYQDLSLRNLPSLQHIQHTTGRSDISHRVSFTPGSRLFQLCGASCYTNTYHHQCVHDIGSSLSVTGSSSDGIAEAIESSDHPFAVGVQWHPECMYDTSEEMRQLFCTFISASSY